MVYVWLFWSLATQREVLHTMWLKKGMNWDSWMKNEKYFIQPLINGKRCIQLFGLFELFFWIVHTEPANGKRVWPNPFINVFPTTNQSMDNRSLNKLVLESFNSNDCITTVTSPDTTKQITLFQSYFLLTFSTYPHLHLKFSKSDSDLQEYGGYLGIYTSADFDIFIVQVLFLLPVSWPLFLVT